jgi:nucleotide-binding universal stress UspA family protein
MLRNVLVAVDGSQAATDALQDAIELARRTDARLTLISVGVPPRRIGWPAFVPYPTDDELKREAEEVLDRARALVPEDLPVSAVARVGRAPDEILAQVARGEHDVVVMGSRGLGRAGSFLLGSVSIAVVAQSSVPVLINPAPVDLWDEAPELGLQV